RLIFPVIRELSLTDVPLAAGMARAVNFGTLRSLTLLRCQGWYVFLAWAIKLKLPIRLKTFGIHIIDNTSLVSNRLLIGAFLSSFKGLENLFIDEPERQGLLVFWDAVACHQPALKKFVHQQRTCPSDRYAFSSARVVPRLPLLNLEMLQLQRGPFAAQLCDLDLEFVGLPCRPLLLVPVLSLCTRKTSLKVLHIRQPAPVRSGVQPCWALHDRFVGRHPSLELRSTPSEINNVISGCRDETAAASLFRSGLRSEFRDFAEWVFGQHGIGSLQFLVFGDYSFGGRKSDNRLILCRNPMLEKKSNFQILTRSDTDVYHLDEYRDALRACPTHA
ncbi:hypothetical protein F5144DRAFT_469631, partial [Chaetomium tenue]